MPQPRRQVHQMPAAAADALPRRQGQIREVHGRGSDPQRDAEAADAADDHQDAEDGRKALNPETFRGASDVRALELARRRASRVRRGDR